VQTSLDDVIAAVRRFNRFYTRRIGVLPERQLGSPFSLAEMRVLYELAHRERPQAAELQRDLGLDSGELGRILKGFARSGYIEKRAGGRAPLVLTERGRAAFAPLDSGSQAAIGAMLEGLAPASQGRIVGAMRSIEGLLAEPEGAPIALRPHRPGDMGWVIARHGALYAEEYGWDETFEALVAEIAAGFIRHFDPARERCWIAERAGEPVGSVFLVRASDEVAKLRLLLVEPSARGSGLGRTLVDECARFARAAGYAKITLWTNSCLLVARRIYETAGYRLVEAKPHRSFGHDLVGETWELDL
jgi:DNA-binding MarR family transcriptional regulator/GNAT superfamily N-acetyltransferase